MIGGMIWPPVEATDSTAAAKAGRKPVRFINGMVIGPSTITFATAEPERFTANMAKAQRKGRMFLDYLRNQRGATAILPYSARAREGAPVAAPVDWEELDDFASGAAFSVRDAAKLIERAGSRRLQGWGLADQVLPDL